MAQIPSLERFQPQRNIPQNDRINLQVKDQGSNILAQTEKVSQLAETGIKMYEIYENDKIEQIANVAEQEYTKWNNDQLTKLKSYQGDPTEAFAEYDKAVEQKKKDMLAARPNFGENVMTAVTNRLDKVISKQSIAADHQRGQQQEVYDNNIFESTVKLKKDGMAVNAGYIRADDPTSFLMLDQNISEIQTTIAKRGIKQGTVKVVEDPNAPASHSFIDDNGQPVRVQMSSIAKARTFKDISEGVKSSIDVLIAGGKTQEARQLQEKYKGFLTPAQSIKLENKFEKAGRKDEAYKILQGLKGKDEDVQIEKIEKINDPELRSEVLKIKDADDRRVSNMRTRKEKANYDTLGDYVLKKMGSSDPYMGIADLENDPESPYAETWDNLSVKQKKAITEMVEAPKESNDKSLVRVQNLFMSDEDGVPDIAEMSPQDFAENLSGLSKSDRAKYTTMYMSLKTQTEGERRAMYKSAGSILRDQLLLDGHIKLNTYGKLDEDDQKTLINARNKLIQYMSNQPTLRDDNKISQFVKQNSAELIKERAFRPVETQKKGARDTASDVKLTRDKALELQRKYKKEFGKFPALTDPAFEAYVKRNI